MAVDIEVILVTKLEVQVKGKIVICSGIERQIEITANDIMKFIPNGILIH